MTSSALRSSDPLSREELVRLNIIHEFDASLSLDNLRGCYGAIAERFYDRMLRDVVGSRILDAGCGFGQFSARCLSRGWTVHSIDLDERSLAVAREVYRLRCLNESVYETSLTDGSIDTVVSNDAICHLDIDRFLREATRLGARRIIVHESNNENPLLRAHRRRLGHQEYKLYAPDEVVRQFESSGFRCVKLDFVNFVSLPISGGFQQRPVPILSRFPRLVYAVDTAIERILTPFPPGRKLAFRFVAVFDHP